MNHSPRFVPYLYVAPLVALLLFVFGYPLVRIFEFSFKMVRGIDGPWIGWRNYDLVLSQPLFWESVRHNMLLLVAVPFMVGWSLLIAVVLYERLKGWKLYRVVLFLPKVMVALLILAFGAYFARFIGNAVTAYCRNVHIQDADILGRLAQYAIVAFVVLIALDQVNVGGDIVRQTFLIVLAGVVLALALAFGLGGKDWAAEMLERWWPRRK